MTLALFFILASVAAAQPTTPAPGSSAESYVLYVLVGLGGLVVTQGGQLLIALVNWRKNGVGNGSPMMKLVEANHKALHYRDQEDTLRPVLSGHTRKRAEECQERQIELLEEIVEGQNKICEAVLNHSEPPRGDLDEEN